ncbi:MAG: formyltransferase family protein [Magnetovibrionaceae bacterium]
MGDAGTPPGIILLCEEHDAAPLARILRLHDPDLPILPVYSRAELEAVVEVEGDPRRLIAFCTGVIVPKPVLDALQGPAYNFHPGPPDYPGLFPAVHALYAGAKSFGATAHEITETIDEGLIVGTRMADVPAGFARAELEAMSRKLVTDLFVNLSRALVLNPGPLPAVEASWGPQRFTRADFEALCELPWDIEEAEFQRRLRALGEGPDHALTFRRFGRRFGLVTDRAGPVVKGGKRLD